MLIEKIFCDWTAR